MCTNRSSPCKRKKQPVGTTMIIGCEQPANHRVSSACVTRMRHCCIIIILRSVAYSRFDQHLHHVVGKHRGDIWMALESAKLLVRVSETANCLDNLLVQRLDEPVVSSKRGFKTETVRLLPFINTENRT